MEVLQKTRSGTAIRFSELNRLDPCSINPLLVPRRLTTVGDMYELLKEWFAGQGSAFGALFVMEGARVNTIYAGLHLAPEQMYFDFEEPALVEGLGGKHLLYIHSRQEEQQMMTSFLLGRLRRSLHPVKVDIEFLQKFETVVSPTTFAAHLISSDGCLKYYPLPIELAAPHLPTADNTLYRVEVELILKNLGVG